MAFILLSLSHFVANLELRVGSLSIWRQYLHLSFNLLADVLLQYMHLVVSSYDAICFVKSTCFLTNSFPHFNFNQEHIYRNLNDPKTGKVSRSLKSHMKLKN